MATGAPWTPGPARWPNIGGVCLFAVLWCGYAYYYGSLGEWWTVLVLTWFFGILGGLAWPPALPENSLAPTTHEGRPALQAPRVVATMPARWAFVILTGGLVVGFVVNVADGFRPDAIGWVIALASLALVVQGFRRLHLFRRTVEGLVITATGVSWAAAGDRRSLGWDEVTALRRDEAAGTSLSGISRRTRYLVIEAGGCQMVCVRGWSQQRNDDECCDRRNRATGLQEGGRCEAC